MIFFRDSEIRRHEINTQCESALDAFFEHKRITLRKIFPISTIYAINSLAVRRRHIKKKELASPLVENPSRRQLITTWVDVMPFSLKFDSLAAEIEVQLYLIYLQNRSCLLIESKNKITFLGALKQIFDLICLNTSFPL